MPDIPSLVDHLFRREVGKMVSYLTRIFGFSRLNLAEDVVQDTLLKALEVWPFHGIPDNPSAWLMRSARNRAIDIIRRDNRFRLATPELTHLLRLREEEGGEGSVPEKDILDAQLRMMFSCCHPALTLDSQVVVILKTLCGFSVSEIAQALLTQEDSVEKRLGRARKTLRETGSFVELTGNSDIPARLEAVYQAVYLLFNEGYHGSRSDRKEPEDLCYEAMRLTLLLAGHPEGQKPKTHALLALMCLHAARLPGRAGGRRHPDPTGIPGPLQMGPGPDRKGAGIPGKGLGRAVGQRIPGGSQHRGPALRRQDLCRNRVGEDFGTLSPALIT